MMLSENELKKRENYFHEFQIQTQTFTCHNHIQIPNALHFNCQSGYASCIQPGLRNESRAVRAVLSLKRYLRVWRKMAAYSRYRNCIAPYARSGNWPLLEKRLVLQPLESIWNYLFGVIRMQGGIMDPVCQKLTLHLRFYILFPHVFFNL